MKRIGGFILVFVLVLCTLSAQSYAAELRDHEVKYDSCAVVLDGTPWKLLVSGPLWDIPSELRATQDPHKISMNVIVILAELGDRRINNMVLDAARQQLGETSNLVYAWMVAQQPTHAVYRVTLIPQESLPFRFTWPAQLPLGLRIQREQGVDTLWCDGLQFMKNCTSVGSFPIVGCDSLRAFPDGTAQDISNLLVNLPGGTTAVLGATTFPARHNSFSKDAVLGIVVPATIDERRSSEVAEQRGASTP